MRKLFWFVAFSEPAMNYGVEARKGLHRADERAEEREALDAGAERELRQRDAEARRKALFAVAAPAAALAFATAPTAQGAEMIRREFPCAPVSHVAAGSAAAAATRLMAGAGRATGRGGTSSWQPTHWVCRRQAAADRFWSHSQTCARRRVERVFPNRHGVY